MSYLYPRAGPENLTILTRTQVKRVLFDEDRRATGVEVTDNAFGKAHTISARAARWSSPPGRSTLPKPPRSRASAPAQTAPGGRGRAAALPGGVGSHLQDHPEAVIQWEAKKPMVEDSTQWWEIGVF
ncbi:GMC family oxidoreductase N-terminal domain-containing protein [Kocuria rhizophila]|nr:GMC family oxidoreductase N-terminal domain-containing protein [Kocuria rhizophila]